jgi:UDP-glucose 4-epimerase
MLTRAVVTGGAGFIGATLVDRIADEGAQVLVVDDLSGGRLARLIDARATGNVTFHQADIRQPELVDLFARFQPEVVFHLAAQIDARRSVVEPVLDTSVNLVGTVNVLQSAVEAGASRVVFSSSGGAQFGTTDRLPTPETEPRRPESPYGVAKGVTDRYLEYFAGNHDLDYMSLGFSNVYGPGQDPHGEAGVVAIFVQALLQGRTPKIFGDGSITRDYVYVDDVVDACVRAAERGGRRYVNIGTGVETPLNRLFDLVARAAGSSTRPDYAPGKPGDVPRSCLDASLPKEVLGWEPWVGLEEGVARPVKWFRQHPEF